MAIRARTFYAGVETHEVWRMAPTAIEQITVSFVPVLDTGETVSSYTIATDSPLAYGADTSTTTTVTANLLSGVDAGNYVVTVTATISGSVGRICVWTCTVQVRNPLP